MTSHEAGSLNRTRAERWWLPVPDRCWSVLAPALVLLCYLPVVFLDYGFSEDYRLLAAYDRGAGLQRLMIAEGRPGFALWAHIAFSGLNGIGSLRLVRLVNVLLLTGLAGAITQAWRRAGWRRPEAAVAGVLAVTLPSFQLIAGTASMGAVAVAALCGVGASFLALGSSTAQARVQSLKRGTAASLLLLIGLATYQSAGLLYFAMAAVFLIAPNAPRPVFVRTARIFATVAAPALVAEFLIFLAGRGAFLTHLLGAPRGDLVFAPSAKAAWFIFYPLSHALHVWKLEPGLNFAFAMMIALAAGILLHLRSTGLGWARAFTALVLLPLCYLPNLVVAENRSSFRSLTALGAIVLFYYLIVLRGQFGLTRRLLYQTTLTILLVVGLVHAVTGPARLIALPQVRELAIVREILSRLPPDSRFIGVIPADPHDSLAPVVLYDEFGYPSTSLPWSTYGMTYLVMRELHPQEDTAAFRVLPPDMLQRPDTIIDWGVVLREYNSRSVSRAP